MQTKKVIIVTDKEYSLQYEPVLKELFEREIVLFCAWGRHCEQWELGMDLFVTDPVRCDEEHHVTTTSHPDESFEDVMNMAECWHVEDGVNEVEVIKL